MQNKPLISIIIPVYNIENYISKCLDSVLAQTYENIEVICVNDQSPDGSRAILGDYAQKDSRIKIIDKQNEGVSLARNAALEVASGEYIMFVDGDDWIDVDACQVSLETAMNTNTDAVLFGYVREFENASLEKHIFSEAEIIFDKDDCKNILCRRMAGPLGEELGTPENADALSTIWGKLYRADLIKNNNIIFKDIRKIGTFEDGLFNLDCFFYAESAVFINKPFYHYRKTNVSSITTAYKEKFLSQWLNLFSMIEGFITDKNCGDNFKSALQNRVALSVLGQGFNILKINKNVFFKIKELKKILRLPCYRTAYKNLQLKYFPLHWKLFYGAAKLRCASLVYILLIAITKLMGRR